MTFNRKKRSIMDAVSGIKASDYKKRLSLVVATMIAFTNLTAFSTSQSQAYTVKDGNNDMTVYSDNKEAATVATEAGLKLGKNDVISFGNDKGTEEQSIIIARRYGITVNYHGETRQMIVAQKTVGDVLNSLGLTVDKDDVLSPNAKTTVTDGMTVSVDKISYKQTQTTSLISYDEYLTLAKSSDTVNKLIEKTSNKIKVTRKFKVKFANGRQTSSEMISQTFSEEIPAKKTDTTAKTAKSSDKKTSSAKKSTAVKSTKKKSTSKSSATGYYDPAKAVSKVVPSKYFKVDKNGKPVSYKKIITGTASAYSGGGYTATGRPAMQGYVAVDPRIIPYGTRLYICSKDGRYNYGYAIAADTGGFIYWGTRIVDLYLDSESACESFGLRDVDIYVLD